MTLIAYVFPKLKTAKDVNRQMTKILHFRTLHFISDTSEICMTAPLSIFLIILIEIALENDSLCVMFKT